MTAEDLYKFYYTDLGLKKLRSKESKEKFGINVHLNRFFYPIVRICVICLFIISSVVLLLTYIGCLWCQMCSLIVTLMSFIGYIFLESKYGQVKITDNIRYINDMLYSDYISLRLTEYLKDNKYIIEDKSLSVIRISGLAGLCYDKYTALRPRPTYVGLTILASVVIAVFTGLMSFFIEWMKQDAGKEVIRFIDLLPCYLRVIAALLLFCLCAIGLPAINMYGDSKTKNSEAKKYLNLQMQLKTIAHELQFEEVEEEPALEVVNQSEIVSDSE